MDNEKYTVPGTNIRIGGVFGAVLSGGFFGGVLSSIFGFGSGLLLSQITHIADNLTKETIQNWVKRSFIDPPRNGRFYDENQVARILIFNALRRAVELEDIRLLLESIRDSSGGTLAEKELLEIFNNTVVKTRGIQAGDIEGYERASGEDILRSLDKKACDKAKIKEVIFIMLTAYQSCLLKQKADEMIYKLKTNV
jgi:DNA-binding transcriptional MerR regulator